MLLFLRTAEVIPVLTGVYCTFLNCNGIWLHPELHCAGLIQKLFSTSR